MPLDSDVMPLDSSAKTSVFEKAIETLNIAPGSTQRILDFGCGRGELLGRLFEVVGSGSRLVGFDAIGKSIEAATATYPGIEFIRGRFIEKLPFPDSAFDVVVTVDAIENVSNKELLVSEFRRVLRPSGQVLAMHWDWDTQTYNIQSREIARKAVAAFSDWKQPWMDEADGQMGRKLWGLFEGSGQFQGAPGTCTLVETLYESGKYGYDRVQDLSSLVDEGCFDSVEYQQFCRELSESIHKGEYLYTLTSFLYYGVAA